MRFASFKTIKGHGSFTFLRLWKEVFDVISTRYLNVTLMYVFCGSLLQFLVLKFVFEFPHGLLARQSVGITEATNRELFIQLWDAI